MYSVTRRHSFTHYLGCILSTPRKTAEEIEGERKVAQRLREIIPAESEAVDGLERKRKNAEGKAKGEIAVRQLARLSAGGGGVSLKEREKIFDAFYSQVP